MKSNRDLELLYEIGALRFIQRSWKRFLHPFAQNITEHTYRVIWIALIIAKQEGSVNCEKMLKMALVHDLSESRSGDVDYISRLYTKANEALGIEDIFAGTSFEKEYVNLWKEYEDRSSLEAKIVKDADNLDVDFELREQKTMGNQLHEVFTSKRKDTMDKILYTKTAKQIWKDIQSSNPHDWHLKGRNRFSKGDWKNSG